MDLDTLGDTGVGFSEGNLYAPTNFERPAIDELVDDPGLMGDPLCVMCGHVGANVVRLIAGRFQPKLGRAQPDYAALFMRSRF